MKTLYYHTCGYPILFEARSTEAATVAIFWDGSEEARQEDVGPDAAEENGEPIEECPGCGEILLLGDLAPEPREEWW